MIRFYKICSCVDKSKELTGSLGQTRVSGNRGFLRGKAGLHVAFAPPTFWKGMPEDTNSRRERRPSELKFTLGQTVVARTALGVLTALDIAGALYRHQRGDWGEVRKEDARANERALKQGKRLLSVCRAAAGVKFWVISEWDRSVSTVLLPEDY